MSILSAYNFVCINIKLYFFVKYKKPTDKAMDLFYYTTTIIITNISITYLQRNCYNISLINLHLSKLINKKRESLLTTKVTRMRTPIL